jgi:serine/threonine protein kinase/predicted Zn-dependent peptidase
VRYHGRVTRCSGTDTGGDELGDVDSAQVATVVGTPASAAGLDSLVVLQRARARMLGRAQPPIRIGRYTIVRTLGAGGMGVVYEAYDADLDRAVALKVLRTELDRDPERRDWLMREAKALAKLSHPNVVHVYEVGRHEEQVYLAMELVAGQTFRDWVDDDALAWSEIVAKYVQAGHGLIAAHEAGVVHRDFKPDNVLLGKDGRARVLDFGLARPDLDTTTHEIEVAESSSADGEYDDPTMTATIVGTPAYMDPQRLMGYRADHSSDQFAFCVALYEALHGRRPYEGASSIELLESMREGALAPSKGKRGRVPWRLHEAITRGLAFSPGDRHTDMRALVSALERAARKPRVGWMSLAGVAAAAAVVTLAMNDRPGIEALSDEPVSDPASSATDAILAASDLPDPIDSVLPDDPAGVTVHRLDNGLTVYLAHRPDRPQLTTRVVIRAGLREETQQTRGIAGLTTAAIVKGSDRLGTVDFEAEKPLLQRHHALLREAGRATDDAERDRLVHEAHEAYRDSADWLAPGDGSEIARAIGVGRRLERVLNGVVVHAEVPATRFEAWARLQAEELRAPVFRAFTDAANERLEGIGWIYAGAEVGVAMDNLLAEVGAPAPDPDGEATFLRTFPLDAVMQFHRTYYVPNNVALVVVGDIRADEALPALEAAFGDWEPGRLPATRAFEDEPWPGERRFASIEDPRGRSVVVGFPLPPPSAGTRANFEALKHVLAGQEGLLHLRLNGPQLVTGASAYITSRGLILAGGVTPEATHEETEAALVGVLEDVAQDRIDDEVWAHVMAHRELVAVDWARAPDALADLLADSYVERRQWAHQAPTLAPKNVRREDIVQAAKRVLQRGIAVLHTELGEPWRPKTSALELPRVTPVERADGSLGELGRALADLPARELEPRFLIDGRHYARAAYGNASLITTKIPGPLFYATWVVPVGVRHDPFVCDAVRYRADSWIEQVDAFASAHLGITCGTTTTTFELSGVAERFDEIMAGVSSVLSETSLDVARLPAQVERTIAIREQRRTDPIATADAFHAFALRRDASLDRWMPSDEELRQAPIERFERALTVLTAPDPHILYAGPRPERLASVVPAATGIAAQLEPFTLDPPDGSTVYLLSSPRGGRVEARLSIIRSNIVDRTGTLADAFGAGPPPGLAAARREFVKISQPTVFHFVAHDRPAHVWFYSGPPRGVLDVVQAAIEELREASPAERMATLRPRLEDKIRLGHVPNGRIPDVVLGWGSAKTVDPRMEQWASIGRLDDADLAAYTQAISQQPVIVSVVAAPADIDRRSLEAWGTLEEPGPADFLRDTYMTDTRVPGPR